MMWGPMGGMMGWGGGLGMAIGGLFSLVFWALLVVVVVLGVRWLWLEGRPGGRAAFGERRVSGDSALDILRQRYARGEIDHDEFEARKRDLVG